jgi:excisionase family DNA binding protein
MQTPPDNELLSYRDVARLCGVPIGTVYSWVHLRRVPHLRLGRRLVRFRRSAVETWLKEREVRPIDRAA